MALLIDEVDVFFSIFGQTYDPSVLLDFDDPSTPVLNLEKLPEPPDDGKAADAGSNETKLPLLSMPQRRLSPLHQLLRLVWDQREKTSEEIKTRVESSDVLIALTEGKHPMLLHHSGAKSIIRSEVDEMIDSVVKFWKKKKKGEDVFEYRCLEEDTMKEVERLREKWEIEDVEEKKNALQQKIDEMEKLNGEKVIKHKYMDTWRSDLRYGYYTVWAYFHEFDEGKIKNPEVLDRGAKISLKVGSLSYAELPHPENSPFECILGVTGTLQAMSPGQVHVIKNTYKIDRWTCMPSVYGEAKLTFDEGAHFKLLKGEEEWFRAIENSIKVKTEQNGAVLVFFESEERIFSIDRFGSEIQNRLQKLLTGDKKSIKDQRIMKAKLPGQATLMPVEFGRGVDFETSRVVESTGGVHVIQTFFSDDIGEEIQIKGRTARADKFGSFEIIACYDDVDKFAGKNSMALSRAKDRQSRELDQMSDYSALEIQGILDPRKEEEKPSETKGVVAEVDASNNTDLSRTKLNADIESVEKIISEFGQNDAFDYRSMLEKINLSKYDAVKGIFGIQIPLMPSSSQTPVDYFNAISEQLKRFRGFRNEADTLKGTSLYFWLDAKRMDRLKEDDEQRLIDVQNAKKYHREAMEYQRNLVEIRKGNVQIDGNRNRVDLCLEYISNIDQGTRKLPVHMVILLDVSGSMKFKDGGETSRLDAAKVALDELLTSHTNPTDLLSLFTFNNSVTAQFEQKKKLTDESMIRDKISAVTAQGGTALYDAIITVVETVEHANLPGPQWLIVVCDGADSRKGKGFKDALQKLQGPDHVSPLHGVVCIGVSKEVKGEVEENLKQFAQSTNEKPSEALGKYVKAENIGDIAGAFEQAAEAMRKGNAATFSS